MYSILAVLRYNNVACNAVIYKRIARGLAAKRKSIGDVPEMFAKS